MNRLLSADLLAETLRRDENGLATGVASFAELNGAEIGIWDAGPGTDTDVESDEVFLVLAGSGSVTFADGTTIELRPGVLVRLYAGDRTTWVIHERLRKLFIA